MAYRSIWLLLLSGCAGELPAVIEDREVPSAVVGPSISVVKDVGSPSLPDVGVWHGQSDGVAVPGELLLIDGSSFGRLPTVTVGGRAATLMARTDGGGVVVRVPRGVPSGDVEVAITQAHGKATARVRVKRYALALYDEKVAFLEVGRDGLAAPLPLLPVPGARALVLHADGTAAYVLAGDRMLVIDMTAPGGPKLAGERRLKHKATMLTSADAAPVLAALGDGKMTIFVAKDALRPLPWEPTPWPKEASATNAIALSADGKTLAALIPDGNRLEVFDLDPPRVKRAEGLALLPEAKLPLVRDLSFAVDNETLWVVSGTNSKSWPAAEPTTLTAVRLLSDASKGPKSRILSLWRTQAVPGAAAPLHLALARGQPLASGTTIRTPPEKAAVFVTAVNDQLWQLAKTSLTAESFNKLWKPPPGMMVRAALDGSGGPLYSAPEISSALDLTPDAQLIVAASLQPKVTADKLEVTYGLLVTQVFGMPKPIFIPIGPGKLSDLKPPFDFGTIHIQP
jgi:hypothetical protein